ncbi:hypothetical protein HUJ04_011159, partial [Dendroctonus ponderosae]
LKQPIDSWDALVIHIISLKFDSVTRKEWETEYSKPNMSDLKVFTAFLQEKSRLLETLSMNNPSNLPIVLYVHFETKNIREKGWCLNCLRTNHRTEQCRSSPCRKCSKKHNTLLHNNTFSQEQTSNNASFSYPQAAINDNQSSRAQSVSNDNKLNSDFTYSFHCYYGTSRVLLSTAIVDVLDSDGNMHSCRVMLDSGSESSFITEQMFNKLNLCTTSTNISVSGICLVTSKVALDTSGLKIPPNVILADPSIDQPNSIDILIGIDKFWDLLSTGQIKLVSCNPNTSETLDVTLTKFWELEEKFLSRPLSIEDQRCEESFLKTTTQRPDGHFVVQLPFRHSESYLGHSKKIAIKRFLNLERKLNRNPLLKSDYSKFLEEYEALGHMIRTNFETLQNKPTFFLPHHGVINNTSETTKLRVVFDGSSKSSTGYSLNDILMVGPTVQQDLFSIVLRARKHEIMLTGDIAKMYRQVYVHETQWNLQVILWRPNPSEDCNIWNSSCFLFGNQMLEGIVYSM